MIGMNKSSRSGAPGPDELSSNVTPYVSGGNKTGSVDLKNAHDSVGYSKVGFISQSQVGRSVKDTHDH